MCGTKWNDCGASCNKIYGEGCNRFLRLINNDMWQNGSLHLFYILKFVFSYVMNTHLG